MKKTLIFSVFFGMCLFCLVSSAFPDDCNQMHEAYLDQKIACCQKKAETFMNSRSDNIRKYAEINQQKASYYASAKKSILEDLNARDCCLKPYQINVYLNKRFFAISESSLIADK